MRASGVLACLAYLGCVVSVACVSSTIPSVGALAGQALRPRAEPSGLPLASVEKGSCVEAALECGEGADLAQFALERLSGGCPTSEPRPRHMELKSPITYITDCQDQNGKGRLFGRISTLFPGESVHLVGVNSDYEAALTLVDVVDAYDGRPGIILVNVARRDGGERRKKWENGPPFSWLKLDGKVDIFTTIDGYVVSLLQKMIGRPLSLEVYEIPTAVPHMGLSLERQEHVIHTQFRSFDYLPLLAATLVSGKELPVSRIEGDLPEMPQAICWQDSFGNLKTNVLPEEVGFTVGESLLIQIDEQRQLRLPCYNRLKDIPDHKVAITIGSSGLGNKRLLEIVQQGASAAKTLALGSGMRLEFLPKDC
mmetsp:Transcript_43706/g.103858  ORF Transcript_43706/g.103858 Transcript_43706/m.103858 type:complete len:367 (-) Transcript_43706:255-1355(-)